MWISGRFNKLSIDVALQGQSRDISWAPDGLSRINKVITQLEDHYQREVPRSQHGAPWFFFEEHMPENWNWRSL